MTDFTIAELSDSYAFIKRYTDLFRERKEEASVFQSPEWLSCWLESVKGGAKLWIVEGVMNDQPFLLGVFGAPKRKPASVFSVYSAHLNEVGIPVQDAICVEYNCFLVTHRASPDSIEEALGVILDADLGIDELVLRNALPSLSEAAKKAASLRGYGVRCLNTQHTYNIDLSSLRDSDRNFLSAAKPSLRSHIQRSARLYESRGDLTLKFAEAEHDRKEAWRLLLQLHADTWKERGELGVFDNGSLKEFHERFMRTAPEKTHLITLYSGNEAIGCLYNLVHGRRVYNYQSGFRYESDNRLKPGLLAHALAAQSYLEKGYVTYDLLAGDAVYKQRLGQRGEKLSSVVIDCATGLLADIRKGARSLKAACVQ